MNTKNTICLWFNKDAHDAARFYAATFPDSRVTAVHKAPSDYPGGKKGDDLTVEFSLKKRDARFRFGVLTGAPIVQRGFWEPHVKAALASPDPLKALFNVDTADEPVAVARARC